MAAPNINSQFSALFKLLGWHGHPRNGKIARLPEPTRTLINQMLDDGFRYRTIVERLRQSAIPPLPYPISEMNLSNWYHGGYQDWLHDREMDEVRRRCSSAKPALTQFSSMANSTQLDLSRPISTQVEQLKVKLLSPPGAPAPSPASFKGFQAF